MQALRALSKPQVLWQDAADAVRRTIITGELAAGERVSEAGLAARRGVSRQPARDAVRLLVQEGRLAHRDGVTTPVGCTEEDVRRLYRFREHLEAYAARGRAWPRVAPSQTRLPVPCGWPSRPWRLPWRPAIRWRTSMPTSPSS